MEENKNNNSAIDKTEQIANESKNSSEKWRQEQAEKKRIDKENRLLLKEQEKNRRKIKRQEQQEQRKKKKEDYYAYKTKVLEDRKQRRLEQNEKWRENKRLKQSERLERRKRSNGVGGWITAVVSLSAISVILASLLMMTVFTPFDGAMAYDVQARRNFYDLVECVDSIDVNLSKLVVSNDSEEQQRLLGEIRVQSTLATDNLTMLTLQDETKYNTTKFINQVGDFSKMLSYKLIEGENITTSEKESLNIMYEVNSYLKKELDELSTKLDKNFTFKSLFEGKNDNLIISKFTEMESNIVTYPTLIYDGAFSDNVNNDKAKGLENLSEISKTEAEQIVKTTFSSYNLKEINLVGETLGVAIETYNFEAVSEDDVRFDASISKKGGKVIEFNHYKDCSKNNYDVNSCEEIATKFLEKLGLKNMKAVWRSESEYTLTFNFASLVDGVICYNDLVKVNVCRERGEVSGMEAKTYYSNHTTRSVNKVAISLDTATKKVSQEISIETSRLAIIPKGQNKEVLAYEFSGTRNDDVYYIYIDAITGKEVNIFKVVKTSEGVLLM